MQTSRPYKIKDINKLDYSIPTTIIQSASEEVKPSNDNMIERIKALKQNKINVNAIKPPTTMFRQDKTTTEQFPEAEDYEDTVSDESLAESSNFEMVDFNIDQSMFNPKTLLQCLLKDDDLRVVPPPVEFRDDVSAAHEAFGSPSNIELDDNDHGYLDYSIFDTQSHAVLTPRKEIETWTFSENDNEYTTRFNPRGSCTVMRTKTPVTSTTVSNVSQNSKSKLDKFTYKMKRKYKM